jgi:repressor LexA
MTVKLKEIYQFIVDYYLDNNFTPTVREICKKFNIKSTSSAHILLRKLEDDGHVKVISGISRGISIVDMPLPKDFIEIPLAGKISAGLGKDVVVEEVLEMIPVPKTMFSRGASVSSFLILKVEGSSMIEAGIHEDDYVIIKKQPNAENGQIIAAIIDGDKATIKRFYNDSKGIRLHPENKNMQDIYPGELAIAGVAVGVYRKLA